MTSASTIQWPHVLLAALVRGLIMAGLSLILCGCGQAVAAEDRSALTSVAATAAPTMPRSAPKATAASATATPAADGMILRDDAIVTLAPGEAGAPSGLPITLRFVELLEDSRCPEDVRCVWAGRLVVVVEARPNGGAPVLLTLGQPGITPDAPASQSVGELTISVEELLPYPAVNRPTPAEAYRLTLLVTRDE